MKTRTGTIVLNQAVRTCLCWGLSYKEKNSKLGEMNGLYTVAISGITGTCNIYTDEVATFKKAKQSKQNILGFTVSTANGWLES